VMAGLADAADDSTNSSGSGCDGILTSQEIFSLWQANPWLPADAEISECDVKISDKLYDVFTFTTRQCRARTLSDQPTTCLPEALLHVYSRVQTSPVSRGSRQLALSHAPSFLAFAVRWTGPCRS
jgi:hypothetical protein